jgi:cyclopropane-fatty-acyl-phospholipid synthase
MLERFLHAALEKMARFGTLRVTYPSGRSETYGDGSGIPVALRLVDVPTMRRIARDPTLATPEAYMDGGLVLEDGDIYDLIMLAKQAQPEGITPGAAVHHALRSVFAWSMWRAIGIQRARANVAHHYDLDEQLYRLFLDGDMQYSCAYF